LIKEYGYGTIAVVIVSLLALLGIFLIPFFKRRVYDDILMVLTALAIGTLFSDTMLHILPEILGVESDDDSDAIRVPDYTLKVVGAMFALYVVWLIETLLHRFTGMAHVRLFSLFPRCVL